MAGRKTKRGTSGNAAHYVTRNQALKKLQLHLGEFRRLCILKGIHPREPNKKTQGQNKTYYHVKDLAFLAHEPLIHKLRQQHAYEKKIRKAKAKRNADLAKQLAERRPTYTLDRLIKERYPSFMDALRDLDDPLTLTHLFAVLPAEGPHNIPSHQVAIARQLGLEWQAYVVRAHALRKVFVSVKGFYFQAEVMGQTITWLVPHQLAQVLPTDVDYRVMLTFLEFYSTMLRFVHFRLYHSLGATYPPRVDSKLDAAATGIAAIMTDLAAAATPAAQLGSPTSAEAQPTQQRLALPAATAQPATAAASAPATAAAAPDGEDDSADETPLSIDSGAEDSNEEEQEADADAAADSPEVSDDAAAVTEALPKRHAATAQMVVHTDPQSAATAEPASEAQLQGGAAEASATPAGGALSVPHDDEAAVCTTLFRGLVFYLGREAPREPLLLVIRSFGGAAAWAGEGSPLDEADESITHQVIDRPTQGHRFLSRQYVQPQWVFDSANFRVLAEAAKYAPGATLPPHLSPFVKMEAGDEEEHVPDYALELRRLQDIAKAARDRAAGAADQQFLEEAAAGGDTAGDAAAPADPAAPAAAIELQYDAELRSELQAAQGEDIERAAPVPAAAAASSPATPTAEDEEAAMADIMMTRKKRKLYNSVVKAKSAKRARAETLKARAEAAGANKQT